MKDIKMLYLTARSSGREEDVLTYNEAINEIVENRPYDYLPHLEYIISSSIGVNTFLPFVEKYGFPIAAYDDTMTCFKNCHEKCITKGYDGTKYEECISWLENYRKSHIHAFAMYEFYSNDDSAEYISTFYKNSNGHQNRLLAAGMIQRFGESAIPDIIITASTLGNAAITSTTNYIRENFEDRMLSEWLVSVIPESVESGAEEFISIFSEQSASSIVESFHSRVQEAYRESMIMDKPQEVVECTDEEVEAMRDLISFKEYQILWLDEFQGSIMESQNEIYSLYEELSKFLGEDVSDSVIPMRPATEDTWFANTQDKKTGKVPRYIAQNHSISNYGEDDSKDNKGHRDDDDDEVSLDSYLRSRQKKTKVKDPITDDSLEDDEIETSGGDAAKKSTNDDEDEPASKGHGSVNNYYYYTYTNSLNRSTNNTHNTNSFNRHDSHNTDDHSRDDHSRVINSYNRRGDKEDESKNESTLPWALNIFTDNSDVIMEDTGDADNDRPESDHPVRDAFMDLDRKRQAAAQNTRQKAQNVKMATRAATKPITRTKEWLINTIQFWKDKDETNIKEKMADPHARSNLFNAIKTSIVGGSLLKAGILLNPVFLFLGVTRLATKGKREFRIRNEMIGELKNEILIVEEKIKDADYNHDNKAKYQLMRFKNELNKKLLRVGGGKEWKKII